MSESIRFGQLGKQNNNVAMYEDVEAEDFENLVGMNMPLEHEGVM